VTSRCDILLAHGSRHPDANAQVAALAASLATHASRPGLIRHAFLELAHPNLSQVVLEVVAAGVTEVRVLPFFLAAGRHVAQDAPTQILTLRERHPQVRFVLLDHLGAAPELTGLLTALFDRGRLLGSE